MNANCYKTVFSKRLGALVAVGEHASSQGQGNGASGANVSSGSAWGGDWLTGMVRYVGVLTGSFALVSLAWAGPVGTTALPTGGQVAQGAAAISQAGAVMNINQSTAKAVLNWTTFDIGQNAKVNIVQPGADAVMLNRVTSANPSQILGQLNANGQVVLVNPNGILFGKDGSVNASSFTASTLGISDANFMAGNQQYERNGSTAAVVNQGRINTKGGYVALLGASVSNEGQINTQGGTAYLAAAETVKIPVSGSGRIKLELSPSRINAALANGKTGTIVTEGGQVYMQAAALNNAVASIIQSGSIDTTGEQGGAVHLLADGGNIKVDGAITANSMDTQNKGGSIVIGRDEGTGALAQSTDVSGAKLESQGGFVETSGHALNVEGVQVKAANWLLDPDNIDITGDASAATAGYSKLKASDIATALNAGTNVTVATTVANQSNQPAYKDTAGTGSGTAVTGDGNILVNAAIVKSTATAATLTLSADNGITVNQRIGRASGDTSSNSLTVNMTALGNAATVTNSSGITLNNVIDAGSGNVTLTGINKNTNGSSRGVTFANGSGITANTITVTGTATGSAEFNQGVIFSGASSIQATGTGNSVISGISSSSAGAINSAVVFNDGSTVILDGGTGGLTVQGTHTLNGYGGIRFGANGGSSTNPSLTTRGSVTLGTQDSSNASLNAGFLMRGGLITAETGALTIKGQATGTAINFFDGNATLKSNGGSLTLNGVATTSGHGVYFNSNQIGTLNSGGDVTIIGSGMGGNQGVQFNGGNVRVYGKNVTINGTANTASGQTGYGFYSMLGPFAGNTITAAGNLSITGTLNGAGSGTAVAHNYTNWQNLVNSYTAGGTLSITGTNNTSASNTSSTITMTGVQARASGDLTVSATASNAATDAIFIYSASYLSGGAAPGYQGGASSFVSTNGNTTLKSNQGSILIQDGVPNSVTSTAITGKNVIIDNTGGTFTGGVFTAGSGTSTSTTRAGVQISDGLAASDLYLASNPILRTITASDTNGQIVLSGKNTGISSGASLGVRIGGTVSFVAPTTSLLGTSTASNGVYTTAAINASNDLIMTGVSSSQTNQQGGVVLGSAITTGAAGKVNIAATDSNGGSNWAFYQATGANINAGTGGVTINATGSGANSALDIYGNITTTGAVSLTGNAGVGGGSGIWTSGTVGISGTSVTMNGTGGTTNGAGAYLNVGTTVTATTGDVSITGRKPSSNSTAAINFAGTINGVASKNINLTGGLTGAGSIATNGAAVNLNNTLSATDTSTVVISGAGSVRNQTGLQTLNGTNTYTGATFVSAGTLSLGAGAYSSSGYDVLSGAVLNFNIASGANTAGATLNNTTFTGAGTITKTGTGTLSWGTGAATFNMSAGGLIDVQAGTFIGGSNANEFWTNNQSSLNVAAGATFDTAEAAVHVDALTGAGTVKAGSSGWANSGLTVGVNNTASGPAIFSGVIQNGGAGANQFIKTGTGTQILTGTNTYTGTTTITGGTLQVGNGGTVGTLGTGAVSVAAGSNLNFYRSNTLTSSNAISGAGNINFSGTGVQGQSDYALSGNNSSFSGNITVSASRLGVTGANQVGTAAITVNSGAGLYVNGGFTLNNALSLAGNGWNESTWGYLGALRLQSSANYGGTIALSANARIGAHNDSGTVSGLISGAYNLEFNTPSDLTGGTIYLTNNNTYSGTTTINSGILQVGSGGSTGTLGTGAVVDNGALVFNRTGTSTVSGSISGTGTLTQSGSGTTILAAGNAYRGLTTVSSGTLQIGNGGSTGTLGNGGAVALFNGANLNFVRNANTSIDNTISGNGNINANITGTSSNLTLNNSITLSGATGSQTNNAILSTTGSITQAAGKSIGAKNLYMTASGGSIGTSGQRISTSVDSLSLNSAGNQFVTEADAVTVASQTTANGSVDVLTTGALTVGSVNSINGINGINGITTNGTGGVKLTGGTNALAGSGVTVSGAVSAGGNMSIDGKSGTGFGVWITAFNGIYTTNAVGTPSNVTIKGESASNSAVAVIGEVQTNNGSTLRIEGTGTNGAKGIYGEITVNGINFGKIGSSTSGDVTLIGTSTGGSDSALGTDAMLNGGYGVLLRGNVTSQGKINITGTSDYQPGVFLQHSTYDYGRTMAETQPTIQVVTGGAAISGDAIHIQGTNLLGGTVNKNGVLIGSQIINSSNGGATTIFSDKGGVALLTSTTTKAGVTTTGSGSIQNDASAGAINITAGTDANSTASIGAVLANIPVGNNVQSPWTITAAGTNITQNSNAGVNLKTTGQGNLTVPKITNNGAGNVVLAAGSAIAAGTGTGGQVKTVSGNTVSSAGKTLVFTGTLADTGVLSNLDASLTDLYASDVGITKRNLTGNKAYASGYSIANGAQAQAIFRQAIDLGTVDFSATVTKTYGDVGYTRSLLTGGASQLKADLGTALTALGSLDTVTKSLTASAASNIKFNKSTLIQQMDLNSTDWNDTSKFSTSNNRKVSASVFNVANPATSDFTLTTAGTTANLQINQKSITTAQIASAGNTYGGPVVAGNVNLGADVITNDVVTASATVDGASQPANKSSSGNLKAGTYGQTVATTALSSTDAGNYKLDAPVTSANSYTVAQKSITTAQIASAGNTYGRSVAAGGVSLGGDVITGDVVTAAATVDGASMAANKSSSGNLKAGTYGQTVATTALSSTDAGNYKLDAPVTSANSYTVAQKSITTAQIASAGNTYGGTVAAGGVSLGGDVITGDVVTAAATVDGASQSANKSSSGNLKAGTYGQTVATTALTSIDAGNYKLDAPVTSANSYTVAQMTVSGFIDSVTTTYGTNAATGGVNLIGVIGNDQVSPSGSSLSGGVFSSSNNLKAGTYVQTVNGALSGADAGNYSFSGTSSANYVVNKLAITSQIADVTTTYGTAAQTGATSVQGVLLGDKVNLAESTGTLQDKAFSTSGQLKAGTYKQLVSAALTGADADNYTAVPTTTSNYVVAPKAIAASVTAADKVYDGSNVATMVASGTGVVAGDVVAVLGVTGTFASKNVVRDGSGNVVAQTVTVAGTGVGLGGPDGANYTLTNATSIPSTTAKITPKDLTVTGITASDKVYDGNTTAAINTSAAVLAGMVGGDNVSVSTQAGVGNFASKDVAFDSAGAVATQAVKVSGLSLNGGDAGNYTVTDQSGASAKVLQRALSIAGSVAQDKTVDGSTLAVIKPGQLGNLVAGESLLVTGSGQFDTAELGTNKAVTTVYALANGSNGIARNYTLAGEVLRASILTATQNLIQPVVSPAKAGSSSRVTVAGSSSAGGATGTSDDKPIDPEAREECSVINPEKCECQASTIAGVEMCFAPGLALKDGE
jgi:filamentous hemagglutinin family protein